MAISKAKIWLPNTKSLSLGTTFKGLERPGKEMLAGRNKNLI